VTNIVQSGDATTLRHGDAVLYYTVSYPDTDAAGVVFHGRYFEMAERARNKLINLAGFSYASLSRGHDTLLLVHKINAVYHRSGILEDCLKLNTKLTACRAARTVWLTEIVRDDSLLVSVRAEIVALYASTRSVRQYPQLLLNALAPFVAQPDEKALLPQRF
jgi:acyl-CoA thioester hydrolase